MQSKQNGGMVENEESVLEGEIKKHWTLASLFKEQSTRPLGILFKEHCTFQ